MHTTRVDERTLASTWQAAAGQPVGDDLLSWPPDMFAFTEVILANSETLRFALLPPDGQSQRPHDQWSKQVESAAAQWCSFAEGACDNLPELVRRHWSQVQQSLDLPIDVLAAGRPPELVEALLTMHAVADEACAGLGVALDSHDGESCVYRARGRELLVRTGSMSRVTPRHLRVLPKVRTPPSGRAAFSRYACVQSSAVEARWHKVPARHAGTDSRSEYARILMLPWPLRIRTTDFRPVDGPVFRPDDEPYAFFEFAPDEPLDLDLLDRVLVAAREEAGGVDVVYLPEGAVDASEVVQLEALLHEHGVVFLQTGVREHPDDPTRFAGSSIHMGVNPTLEKGAVTRITSDAAPWWHIRQRKHHRWSLDQRQIEQYHLGGALHPHIRWWEAMDVPRKAVEFVEVAELTLACLVCEDLAQNDDVAEMIRAVGPTIVFPALLDGPQLTSRWAARYASGLADDPGSAVLTLTSYGMVERTRPRDTAASRVIALWKDATTGVREIELESGSHAVLLTVCMDRASRRSADGRPPSRNGTQCLDAAVHQIRAVGERAPGWTPPTPTRSEQTLDVGDLAVLTGWAEAFAEALILAPEMTEKVAQESGAGTAWRTAFGLPPLSERLVTAFELLAELVGGAGSIPAAVTDVMARLDRMETRQGALERLVGRVQRSMLEERQTRSAK